MQKHLLANVDAQVGAQFYPGSPGKHTDLRMFIILKWNIWKSEPDIFLLAGGVQL